MASELALKQSTPVDTPAKNPLGRPSELRPKPIAFASDSKNEPSNEQTFDLGDHPTIVADYAGFAKVTGWVTPRSGVAVLREDGANLPVPPTPDPAMAGLHVTSYNVALGRGTVKRKPITGVNDHLDRYDITGADGSRQIPMTTLLKGVPSVTYAARILSEENGRVDLRLESHPKFYNQTEFTAHDAHLKVSVTPEQDTDVSSLMYPGELQTKKKEHIPDGPPAIEVDMGDIALLRPNRISSVSPAVLSESQRGTIRSVFETKIGAADLKELKEEDAEESVPLPRSEGASVLAFRAPTDMVPSTVVVTRPNEAPGNPKRGERDLPRYVPAGGRVTVGTSDPNTVATASMTKGSRSSGESFDVQVSLRGIPAGRAVCLEVQADGFKFDERTSSDARLTSKSGGKAARLKGETRGSARIYDFRMPAGADCATLTFSFTPQGSAPNSMYG